MLDDEDDYNWREIGDRHMIKLPLAASKLNGKYFYCDVNYDLSDELDEIVDDVIEHKQEVSSVHESDTAVTTNISEAVSQSGISSLAWLVGRSNSFSIVSAACPVQIPQSSTLDLGFHPIEVDLMSSGQYVVGDR